MKITEYRITATMVNTTNGEKTTLIYDSPKTFEEAQEKASEWMKRFEGQTKFTASTEITKREYETED